MQKESCYQVGFIKKTHALLGEVILFLDVDSPAEYQALDSVFVEIKGQLVPYFIETIALQKKKEAIVKFEGIDSIEQAQNLLRANIYLPLEVLPQAEEGELYYHEIIDFEVIDEEKGSLGKVKSIYDQTPQELIAMDYNNFEVLIPWVDEIVKEVDKKSKQVKVLLPEGLLDLYLEKF